IQKYYFGYKISKKDDSLNSQRSLVQRRNKNPKRVKFLKLFFAEKRSIMTTTKEDSPSPSDKKSVVVFGGNGMIGMGICEEIVKAGFHVVSISRTGSCPSAALKESWTNQVEWRKGDALNPQSYEQFLQALQPVAVVSSIGKLDAINQLLYWKRKSVERIAGDTNFAVCETSKKVGVPKFIYISGLVPHSLTDYVLEKGENLQWYTAPFAWFLAPQVVAKHKVEQCVCSNFDKNHGIVLRACLTFGKAYYDSTFFGLFRLTFSYWLPPFGGWPWVRNYFYKSITSQSATVHEIGDACVRFIQHPSDKQVDIEKQIFDTCEIENFLAK
ncbi:hypothetical protein RFI_03053, partial [Reticulomyxa filosa]